MTGPVPPAALAAARAAVPFVNGDAARRILEAAAPAIEADERERIRLAILGCRDCGKIHERLPLTRHYGIGNGGTWADPDDGHAYRMPRAAQLADLLREQP